MLEPAVAAAPAPEDLSPEDESATSKVYEFDESFQTKIVAMVLRDTLFLQKTDGLIKPEYFTNAAEQVLVAIGLEFFGKYKKAPGDASTIAKVITDARGKKIIRDEMVGLVKSHFLTLMRVDISDRDYVADACGEFARHTATAKAILASVTKLERGDFDGIYATMKQALDVGIHMDTGAYDYFEMLASRTDERLEMAAGHIRPDGITTGYDPLDKLLYHQGWGKAELSVLMGGPKAGKTTALINFAVNALGCARRHNVLYITLEVSAKIISQRIDANISNQMMMELKDHPHHIKGKVEDFHKHSGILKIHEFPSGSMKVSDLRRLIERYKSQGIVFDMVVLDYADLMAPERFTDNAQENSKSIYVNLRGLAMLEGFAVLTATQTNREGAKATVATMTHVAEDFNKVRIADVIISINKTDEERAMNQARLYFVACRNQASGFSIRIQQDNERMKFIKEVIGVE